MKKCYKNQRLHTPRVRKTWFLEYVPVRVGVKQTRHVNKSDITLKEKEGDTSNINSNLKLFPKVVNVTSPSFGIKSHSCRVRHRYVRQPLLCLFVKKCSGRLLLARLLTEPMVSRHSTNIRLTKQSMNCHSVRRSDLVDIETRRTMRRLLLPNFETVYDNFGQSNFELLNSKYSSFYAVLIGPFITSDGADDLQI